jgi:phage FluMu protein Com
MDVTRCPICNKRLMAMSDRIGRTELRCPTCDKIDPMKTDAAKWADTPWQVRRRRA